MPEKINENILLKVNEFLHKENENILQYNLSFGF